MPPHTLAVLFVVALLENPDALSAWMCGPEALYLVAHLEGLETDLAELARIAKTDGSGTAVAGMLSAARHIGLEGRAVRISLRDLASSGGHRIALLDNNTHYANVWSCNVLQDSVEVVERGRIEQMSLAAFRKRWTGIVILLKKREDRGTQLATPLIRFLLPLGIGIAFLLLCASAVLHSQWIVRAVPRLFARLPRV